MPDSQIPPVSDVTWRRRLFARLFDHRRLVLAVSAILTLVFLAAGASLPWREDVMDLLPGQDPMVAEYRRILSDFGQLDTMIVTVGPRAGTATVPPGEVIAAADRLEEQMRGSGLFKSITYRVDAGDFAAALDLLREHRAGLFTPEDAAAVAARLDPQAIREILAGWKRRLTESPTPYVSRALARDPLGLDELLLRKIGAARSLEGPTRIENGRILSRDLRHALLVAETVRPATDNLFALKLVEFMDQAADGSEKYAGGRLAVAYLSGHRFSIENASRIKSDVRLTLAISFVAIALVSLAIYRRPLWVGLTFLPTFFGGVFALGALRLFVPDISAIAIGCGSMLLGVAVDLGIHILCHIDQISDERPRKEQIIGILDRLFWPLVLCSTTTIVAFFALEWSVLPGYRSLGHFAVLGFTGATIFAIFILPLLVPLRRGGAARSPLVPLARVFPAVFAWLARHRRLVLGLLAISLLAILPGLLRLRFEGDYRKMNAVSPRVQRDLDHVTAVFGALTPSTAIVVRGDDLEQSLAANDRLYAKLLDLRQEGRVRSVQSLGPLLPSLAAQDEASRRWRAFWSPARIRDLDADLARAAADLRLRPGVFAPFLASLTAPGRPLLLDDLEGGLFQHLVARHVARDASGSPVLTSLDLPGASDAAPVFAAIRDAGIAFTSFHGPSFMQHIVRLIQREMLWVSAISILLVMLILALYYRLRRDLALILLPLAVCLSWTFGIMGWAGWRINLMNSLIVVFVFGVVVDYSLFLAAAMARVTRLDDPHLANSCVGIVVSATTTMIGLGVLIIARHPALHSIGLTSLLGIGTGVLAVFTIIPIARRRCV